MENYISPNYTKEKLENPSFDDLVDVFEDRMRYERLIPAESLLEIHCGFVAAMIVLFTYFEQIQSYLSGQDSKGKSKEFFTEGFLVVFGAPGKNKSELVNIAKTIYSEGRCGFFHEGTSRRRIVYSFARAESLLISFPKVDGEPDCQGRVQSVVVNPKRFLWCVKRHFDKYISDLRKEKNANLRKCFQQVVDMKWHLNDEPVKIGMTEKEFREQ